MIEVDGHELVDGMRTLLAGVRNNATQAVRAAVSAAEASAKGTRLFNDVTGALRRSVVGTASGLEGKVVAGASYARFVENGTRPHVIEGSPLAFRVNGATVFASRVNHPGTSPMPFMFEAEKQGAQALEYGAEFYTSAAVNAFNRG